MPIRSRPPVDEHDQPHDQQHDCNTINNINNMISDTNTARSAADRPVSPRTNQTLS
ncbi:hypothetical protein [Streptomyces sp. NPDC127595]|uniref:hypothetical protein n=1 Tax=Streptomyces sp. NPDC127595 TaxID=3345405 RepID=UPI00362D79C0